MTYEFTSDWFSVHLPLWNSVLCAEGRVIEKVLEIGSYEGRSAVWIIDHLLSRGGELYCLDTWAGGTVHGDAEMGEAETRFDANIERALAGHTAIRFAKMKGRSWSSLARLSADGHGATFDFIYIDGSHQTPDVLADLVGAFHLCKTGGFIFCDDLSRRLGRRRPAFDAEIGHRQLCELLPQKIAGAQDAAIPALPAEDFGLREAAAAAAAAAVYRPPNFAGGGAAPFGALPGGASRRAI